MKIAFVYFPDFTLLDVVGVYDPLWRLRTLGIVPELDITAHGYYPEARDPHGFPSPTLLLRKSLASYDLVFVPGGLGTRPLCNDAEFLAWLRPAGQARLLASVCTGSLLLGAAGLLKGYRATTHFNEYAWLSRYTDEVAENTELVDAGRVITAGAVASSLLLGLHLCERIAGKAARDRVASSMNYPH